MGYRSEVVFAIDKKVVPLFLAHIASSAPGQALCFKHSDYHTKDYCGGGHWLFRWDYVKWYDYYEDVRAIESFVNEKLQELPESFGAGDEHYRIIVVGEEQNDIQDRGWAFDQIHVSRSINY